MAVLFDEAEKQIIQVTPEAPIELVAEVLDKLAFMKQRIKELEALAEQRMIERIKQTGQDIVVGDLRYYVGPEKKIKPRDHMAIINVILELAAGDFDKVGACLGSSPWKYGFIRSLLDDAGRSQEFDELFETIVTDELKEGKPKLRKQNTRFIN